jgi:hypothetical protein
MTGQDAVHRTARADFNVRGWQGRLRYTALAALFFWGRRRPALRPREIQSSRADLQPGQAYNCRKIQGKFKLRSPERPSIKVPSPASQNKNEEFHKQKIRCPEGTARDLRPCSMKLKQGVAMTAIARALSHAFQSSDDFDALKQIALFCGAGLLVSLVCLTHGLELGADFF